VSRIPPGLRHTSLGLGAAAILSLVVPPLSALADATASPSPSSSPSPIAATTSAPSPSANASPVPSPSASPQTLANKQAQGELIGALTASEAHALMLQKSIAQAELNLMALGQQLLDGRQQLTRLDRRLNDVRSQQTDAIFRLQHDQIALNGVVRRIYKHRENFFAALLESGGFGGLLRVMGYSNVVVDREQAAIRQVQADQVALQHARTTLERGRKQQQGLVDGLSRTHLALGSQLKIEQDLQSQLQQTIAGALSALDASQTDSPAVAAERAKLVQLKTDALLRQIEDTIGAQAALLQLSALAPDDPTLRQSGRLLWPIPNATITQGFGPSNFFFEAAYAGFAHFHTGIDLAVPLGTPVFAAADGIVVAAQTMKDSSGDVVGYGSYVILQHMTGLQTLYGHMLSYVVKPGDVVTRGQLIGLVGSTGNSTGPHTHFEVRIDNAPVDPMQLLPASSAGASSPAVAAVTPH
jgi:murein DD-endopeptidase MepM/ murein hydrolase activator NlpD